MKSLIAYFSRRGDNYLGGGIAHLAVGNTEEVAKTIQKLVGGVLFAIETVVPYPTDYEEATEAAKQELKRKARPELARRVEDLAEYGVVYLGFPNWWGTMPMPVWSFLELHDLGGKTILPFCTHEGGGLGRSDKDIRKLCPHSQILPGLALKGGSVAHAESEVARWLRQAGMLSER